MFTYSSGSYTQPNETSVTAGLNGLNWHVHVDPLSLSTTSLPDAVPVLTTFDEVEAFELEDELPPQAAGGMHTAANSNNHLKRLIDTLRSYYRSSQIPLPRLRLSPIRRVDLVYRGRRLGRRHQGPVPGAAPRPLERRGRRPRHPRESAAAPTFPETINRHDHLGK